MSAERPSVWTDEDGTPTKVRLKEDTVCVLKGNKGEAPVPAGTECWVICPDPDAPETYVLETCDTERPIFQMFPDSWEQIDTNTTHS